MPHDPCPKTPSPCGWSFHPIARSKGLQFYLKS
jgi:hypothetical protein